MAFTPIKPNAILVDINNIQYPYNFTPSIGVIATASPRKGRIICYNVARLVETQWVVKSPTTPVTPLNEYKLNECYLAETPSNEVNHIAIQMKRRNVKRKMIFDEESVSKLPKIAPKVQPDNRIANSAKENDKTGKAASKAVHLSKHNASHPVKNPFGNSENRETSQADVNRTKLPHKPHPLKNAGGRKRRWKKGIDENEILERRRVDSERERSRLKRIADAFQVLRNCLPDDTKGKRGKQLDVLRSTIGYMNQLYDCLEQDKSEGPSATS